MTFMPRFRVGPVAAASAPSAPSSPEPWLRPAAWLSLPADAANTMSILAYVHPAGSNYAAMTISVSTGTYTVDWGNGTVTTHTSGAVAQIEYDFATISSATAQADGTRQVVIAVTPTTGGANLTNISLSAKHTALGGSNAPGNPWLDVQINAPSATTLACTGSYALRRVVVSAFGSITNASSMFQQCTALESLTLPAGFGAAITSAQSMFHLCIALQSLTLPAGFGAAISNAQSMFNLCTALQSLTLPAGFGAEITNAQTMFYQCAALQSLTLPAGFGAEITNAQTMFFQCTALQSLTLPASFGAEITNAQNLFFQCTALQSLTLPAGFGAAITNAQNMFQQCTALQSLTLPAGFGAAITNAIGMFQLCTALQSLTLPAGFGAAITNASNMFSTCSNLRQVAFACPVSFSVLNCLLDAGDLDALYTALPTVSGQSITVTGNPGVTGDDPTIATAKGWTVVS